MTYVTSLIVAGLLAAAPAAYAAKPPITEVVSFGDSLSDCGAFGFKPTTAPALTWNQQLARHYGYDLEPNQIGKLAGISADGVAESRPGGLCYAQGGARTAIGAPDKPEALPISGTVQLDHFLAEHEHFTPNQLVTVYLGTNDILIPYVGLRTKMARGDTSGIPPTRKAVVQAAKDVGALVARILENGAERVAVLNAYDLGAGDFYFADPVLTGLANDFNIALRAALPHDRRVIPVDTHEFFASLAAAPTAHGFKFPMSDDACATPAKLGPDCYTSPAHWKAPDADRTHILIGMVHFTGRTEKLLSDYVIKRVEAAR